MSTQNFTFTDGIYLTAYQLTPIILSAKAENIIPNKENIEIELVRDNY